ncbi:MAG: hypothetical protein GY904_30330 [Planctomycetaceae bacterium]|nr:hypothetical protein [Planctomycetaceae bacterium]
MPRKRYRADETRHNPLCTPVHHPSDLPYIGLFDRVRPRLNARQNQNRLLNLRGQVDQPHAMRHASRGDVGVLSQFGLVLDHAVTNQLVTLYR